MNLADQNAALKAKNRELHAEIDRLTQDLTDARRGDDPSALVAFVQKIAATKSKFAKEARDLLD